MSDNVFTLDNLVAAAKKKFANTVVELPGVGSVVLVNAMQLSKDDRQRLMDSQRRLSDAREDEDSEEVDQVEALEDTLRIVIKEGDRAEALIEAIDGNLATLATLFERYSKGTQLGEASASAN